MVSVARNLAVFVLVTLSFSASRAESAAGGAGGHLYMQSNAIENEVFHFARRADGSLELLAKHATGGKGCGTYKPLTGQDPAPNAFEGAGSVIITRDRQFLFTTNGGDNSVSSFRIEPGGNLTLLDVQPTGEPVEGRSDSTGGLRSGTAKSLAYSDKHKTLYVLHAFGPNHLRGYDVSGGKLSLRPQKRTCNTSTKDDRLATQAVLTPDQKFLLVDVLFDTRPAMNADGSPKLVVTNTTDKDGLVVFPVQDDGGLGEPMFQDAGGAGPFYILFLNKKPETFLNGHAVSDGVSMGRLDKQGRVNHDAVVAIDASAGKPSELCWLVITSDDRIVLATNFGFSNVSSYIIESGKLKLAKNAACPPVPGDGKFRAVNNLVSSGPNDSWLSPDDKFFYQLYPNASVLVGYRLNPDASLTEIGRTPIPYTSPQGLAGFDR